MNIHIVLLSGGSGSRLWPKSRSKYPKQFLDIENNGLTMLENTLKRIDKINYSSLSLICNEDHKFFAQHQINIFDKDASIIIEPEGRNTAPAIAISALLTHGDPILLVLPVDHIINNEEVFYRMVKESLELAEKGHLISFGIKTSSAHTGYGYIKKGSKNSIGYDISKFIEKPEYQKAKEYHSSNEYFWNSGMFLFQSSSYLQELKKYRNDIYDLCKQSVDNVDIDNNFIKINKEIFLKCPSDSIDYAVMEKTTKGVVIPLEILWSDIGSWESLWKISKKDENMNVISGDVMTYDTKNSYISSEDQLVAVVGIDNLIISVTDNAILISDKSKSEDLKEIINLLSETKLEHLNFHRKVHRPWGNYDSIDSDDGFQVKRITVSPKQKLSVQMHHHRSEHWVVVSGTAIVHYGDKQIELNINESTYHDKEVVHALENPGDKPLILIEVQIGEYLGEDDIVRYEDIYGRAE